MDADFIGKDALLTAREECIDKKFMPITLDDTGMVVDSEQPIFDGEAVIGYGCRADSGYTIDAGIVYAYLPTDDAEPGTAIEVRYENGRYLATVREEPLFDPRDGTNALVIDS